MQAQAPTIAVIPEVKAPARALALPWYCLAAVFGAACIPIGALWDISWHSTIGRDTFWTPAHMMIHLGGLVPGFTAGYLVFRNTFFVPEHQRDPSIKVWGFYGPIGAWVIIWGALAMLLSAPFDDWWHNAYGLDVEILSPPHVVLAAGMYAVAIGALLLVLSFQNRAEDPRAGGFLFIFAAGVLLTMSTIILTEKSYPNFQHAAGFYKLACAIYPTYLVATARAAKVRWAATGAALVYTLMMGGMVWILPLFEAKPMLAPIYNQVDHMVPPCFPLLLVLPALAIDLLVHSFRNRRGFWWDTLLALLAGSAFVAVLLPVQWHFSKFMLSPASHNWFFASDRQWPYFIKLSDWRFRFWDMDKDPLTLKAVLIIAAVACVKSRISLAVGNWMSRVKR
jgi:hypothetical protein